MNCQAIRNILWINQNLVGYTYNKYIEQKNKKIVVLVPIENPEQSVKIKDLVTPKKTSDCFVWFVPILGLDKPQSLKIQTLNKTPITN